jgi:hypothetical protein
MTEKAKARRSVPRKFKRKPSARISTLNSEHAAEIRSRELDGEHQQSRSYPEPEPRGRYTP